jgi:hypothetical protein
LSPLLDHHNWPVFYLFIFIFKKLKKNPIQFCDVAEVAINHIEDLAKFGYKCTPKAKKHPCGVLPLCDF